MGASCLGENCLLYLYIKSQKMCVQGDSIILQIVEKQNLAWHLCIIRTSLHFCNCNLSIFNPFETLWPFDLFSGIIVTRQHSQKTIGACDGMTLCLERRRNASSNVQAAAWVSIGYALRFLLSFVGVKAEALETLRLYFFIAAQVAQPMLFRWARQLGQ